MNAGVEEAEPGAEGASSGKAGRPRLVGPAPGSQADGMDPFAPIQPASPAPGSGAPSVPCTRCGAPVDPARATYGEGGGLVCPRCAAGETIAAGEARAGGQILSACVGSVVFALFSLLCFNPLLLFSLLAVVSGAFGLTSLLRQPEYKRSLGESKYGLGVVLAVLGILGGLGTAALHLLAFGLRSAF